MAVYIERRAEKINRTRSGRQGVKERELLEKYGSQEKVDKLKALLKAKGLFEFDPDFPQDEEEWGLVDGWTCFKKRLPHNSTIQRFK